MKLEKYLFVSYEVWVVGSLVIGFTMLFFCTVTEILLDIADTAVYRVKDIKRVLSNIDLTRERFNRLKMRERFNRLKMRKRFNRAVKRHPEKECK